MSFLMRLGLWLFCAALVAGCARKEPAVAAGADVAKPADGSASGLRKIRLQTDWFPQAEHGGFYHALVKGYYKDAGLDVDILPGGPGAGIRLKVARGDADFGMGKSDDVIVSASRGMPFVMVAATMQHDAQAVMVHADSPVKKFKDLAGRTVIAAASMAWIPYVQAKYKIEFNLKPNVYGIGEFLANNEVAQQCLVTNEPYFAEQNGRKVRTLMLSESGYDCYPTIYCRRELTRTSPAVVRAFVWASLRGWRDYLDTDPSEADALILKRNPQMTPELLKFSRSEMIIRSLVHGNRAKGEDVGELSITRLDEQQRTLLDLKIIDAPVAISSVATREFLPPKGAQ